MSGHSNFIPYHRSALTSGECAVAQLIQNMVVKGIYPRPLDEVDLARDATYKWPM